jgi:hypothetical protein
MGIDINIRTIPFSRSSSVESTRWANQVKALINEAISEELLSLNDAWIGLNLQDWIKAAGEPDMFWNGSTSGV